MEKLKPLFNIAQIIAKENLGELTESESQSLKQWLAETDRNKEIYKKLSDGKVLTEDLDQLNRFDPKKAFNKLSHLIPEDRKQRKVFNFIPNYLKYAAVFLLLLASAYLIFVHTQVSDDEIITQSAIFPGKQKAILINSKNQEILLDSSASKQIISDEAALVVQNGSNLSYSKNDSVTGSLVETTYNTLITPYGGEYTLILSDGTEVMLNAGSKLKFPEVFAGNTRKVELEGEAFFKVAKSQNYPFIVVASNINVMVYGTVFNVSAYGNQSLVQATLVEGSIGVSINKTATSDTKIKPGQQFNYNKTTGDSETREVDTDKFIAWTKGVFVFENASIEDILITMARWYNFNFEFKDESLKNQRFTLNVNKNDNVSKILDLISMSSGVKFTLQGNLITVDTQ